MFTLRSIYWYIVGVLEFRSNYTTNPGDDFIEAYDAGRDRAHALTLRYFDEA